MTSPTRPRPVCIDLFAGAGGLSLGFEQAGFDIAAAVEFDPIHAAVHELNFPNSATICQDVRGLTGAMIREVAKLGRRPIDVVVGGPPCQGFSLIGKRVLGDPRNELVFHYVRLVDELRPKTFVFENVAGMASGGHHKLLDELIARFEEIGYKVRLPYRILNASHFGVPQNRRRLILLGARRDTPLPEYPDPVVVPRGEKRRNGNHGQLSLDLALGPSVLDAIRDLPDIDAFPELFESDTLPHRLNGGTEYALRLRGESRDPGDFSYVRNVDSGILTGCRRADHTPKSRRRFASTVPGVTEPISRFLRLAPDGLCNTLRAGTASDRGGFTSPRPIHPIYARCISVREAARLHSYPDWFRFHHTIWHGFRQIGNSVPPLLGRAIAASVRAALGIVPVKPRKRVVLGDDALAHMTMKDAAEHFGVSRDTIPQRTRRT